MWPNPQESADLVAFTEDILMENFIFCAVWKSQENFQVESRFYKKIVCSYARNVLSQKNNV